MVYQAPMKFERLALQISCLGFMGAQQIGVGREAEEPRFDRAVKRQQQ